MVFAIHVRNNVNINIITHIYKERIPSFFCLHLNDHQGNQDMLVFMIYLMPYDSNQMKIKTHAIKTSSDISHLNTDTENLICFIA